MDYWLVSLCLARVFLFANFMVVAASLPLLVASWSLSATQAGSIISAFTFTYAGSLFCFAWAADHFGARQMAVLSSWASAAAALAFGVLATDYWTALIFYGLAGAFQGGVYTPLIMVLADRTPPESRGHALGWLIASTSLGYAISIGVSAAGLAYGGYQLAFIATGLLPLIGALILHATLWSTPNLIHQRPSGESWIAALRANLQARRLVVGYTAHTWELVGSWAWTPALLTASMIIGGYDLIDSAVMASVIAAILHLTGAGSALLAGKLSDRLGRRRVLLGLSLIAAIMSCSIGWLVGLPFEVLAVLVVLHNGFLIGDSPVLSTAITERMAAGHLGAVLALRALTGFGAGALATVAFGGVFDVVQSSFDNEVAAWGVAYVTLGLGGLIAALMAWRLPRT